MLETSVPPADVERVLLAAIEEVPIRGLVGDQKKHVYIILYNNIIIDSPVLHYSYAMCMSM